MLNNRKFKYTFFHKKSTKDGLPLKLSALKVANNKTEKKTAIKLFGVIPVRFEGKSLLANYLNWLKQSHGSKTAIIMSYQKSAIRFYSKNGEFIIKCSITELDIVNIIINITIGNVKTRHKLFINNINILSLLIKKD